ncbi:unnamed protein product [Prorocentrum cordatum]|uniref:Uncharacterized protein n=1 Tax=Prorocentrum cordatum TaxID=2364126 RepID=A0ABN9UGH7_9DINO|nr:unnamed protein product [Polarella glacialis]
MKRLSTKWQSYPMGRPTTSATTAGPGTTREGPQAATGPPLRLMILPAAAHPVQAEAAKPRATSALARPTAPKTCEPHSSAYTPDMQWHNSLHSSCDEGPLTERGLCCRESLGVQLHDASWSCRMSLWSCVW